MKQKTSESETKVQRERVHTIVVIIDISVVVIWICDGSITTVGGKSIAPASFYVVGFIVVVTLLWSGGSERIIGMGIYRWRRRDVALMAWLPMAGRHE
jgi:hypothetical protein